MNKLFLSVILTIFLIVLSGFVLADYTIESMEFMVGDNPVTHILPQHAQVVDIVVNISTNESFVGLKGDLTQVNPNPTKFLSYQNKVFVCTTKPVANQSYYNCRANKVVYIPQTEDVSINFTVLTDNDPVNIIQEKTFSIDKTNPQLKSFKTEYCDGETCFLPNTKPTKILISLTDSTATFYQEKIFFVVGNSNSYRVTSCDGSNCEGLFTETSCSGGDRIQAKIVTAQGVPSSDDAGNPIEGALTKTFICDEYAPGQRVIEGEDVSVRFNISHSGGVLFDRPKSGDTVVITAVVSEDASGVTATSNLTKLGGTYQSVDCDVNPGGLSYTCKFTVANIKGGEFNIPFTFTDGVGRESTHNFEFRVDELVQPEDGEGTPKFLRDITATSPATNGFNRVALQLAYDNNIAYPLFVEYTPQKNHAVPGNVEILYSTISDINKYSCKVYGDGVLLETPAVSFVKFAIANPLADMGEQNKVNFRLMVDPNDINDDLKIVCNVSAVVRIDDDKVYKEPTNFMLTMPLKFKNSRLGDQAPGQKYADKIAEVQESTKTFNDIVGVMNSIYATLQDICNAKRTMNGLGFSFANTQLLGAMFGDSKWGALAPALSQVGTSIATPANTLRDNANKWGGANTDAARSTFAEENFPTSLNINEILTQSCELATCSIDAQDDKTGFNISGGKKALNLFNATSDDSKSTQFFSGMGDDAVEQIFGDINVPDVKESLISAVTARCLPAIVYHLNQYRQMNCHTITCMKTQAAYGTDISVCDQAKAQFICERVVGEVFEIGGIRQVKNVMDNTNSYIQNLIPNTLKSLTQNTFCKGYATITDEYIGDSFAKDKVDTKDMTKLTLCTIPEVLANQMNFARQTTQSKKTFTYDTEEDACQLAYCSSIYPEECDVKGPSYLQQWLGISIPPSTLDMMYADSDKTTEGYQYINPQEIDGLTQPEIDKINERRMSDINNTMQKLHPELFPSSDEKSKDEPDKEGDIKSGTSSTNTPTIPGNPEDELIKLQNQQKSFTKTQTEQLELQKKLQGEYDALNNNYLSIQKDYTTKSYDLNSKREELGLLETEIQKSSDNSALICAQFSQNTATQDNTLPERKFFMDENGKLICNTGSSTTEVDPGANFAEEFKKSMENINKLNKLKPEIESLDAQVTKLGNELNKAKIDYQNKKTELEKVTQDLKQTETSLEELNNKVTIEENKNSIHVLNENELKASTPEYLDDLYERFPDKIKDDAFLKEHSRLSVEIELAKDDPEKKAELEFELMKLEKGLDVTYPEYLKQEAALEKYQSVGEDYLAQQQSYLDKLDAKMIEEYDAIADCKTQKCRDEHANNFHNIAVAYEQGKEYIASITVDGDGKTVNVKALQEAKRQQLEAKKKNIYQLVDTGVAIALQNGYLNWASLTSFGHDTTLGKVSDWSDTWLNSDNYKNKICSANFIKPKDQESQKGAAIQCENSFCVPVLTQAAEKVKMNESHYLYTATYNLGNVRAPDVFTGDETINFNVFFKDGNTLSDKLFNVTWLKVPYSRVAGDTFAFLSESNFDEMCVIFEYPFPPDEIGKKTEYCRPIVNAEHGNSDFDTGSPVPADYLTQVEKMVTTNPGNAPMNTI
ncbi:hypothetical protein JXA48_03710 [Candidatus Woesearchaeota archaeon]|nr:hypothetical protein [Candidatus Woesearchaeota archaeon]